MKRNKILAYLLIFLALAFISQLVLAEEIPGLPGGLQPDDLEKIPQTIEQYQNITEWQLIGMRMQKSLLENSVVANIDLIFTKFTWLFRILFGMHYSLSITLLIVIALWVIFVLDFAPLLKNYSMFSDWTSYGISFGLAVILAQIKIFESIVNFFGTIMFAREGWPARVMIFFAFLGMIILVHYTTKTVEKHLKEQREEEERNEARYAGKELKARTEGIEKGRKLAEEWFGKD